jgi:sec-independent protein translocase protein TatA
MFRNPYADGLIVLLIVLLFFGPKRLPALGRSLGHGMREFRDSITGHTDDGEDVEAPEIERTGEPVQTTSAGERAPAGGGSERSS